MDRELKERLVGASVLVVAMIVVVPLFLNGPAHKRRADNGTVVESVGLPAVESRTHVIQLDAPSPTAPARRSPPASADTSSEQAAQAKEEKTPPPPPASPASGGASRSTAAANVATQAVKSPPPVAATDSGWAVQVGSFRIEKKARGLAEDLRGQKYSAFHVRKNIDGVIFYRVLIGPERDRERADALASRLRADGLPTTIVRHP